MEASGDLTNKNWGIKLVKVWIVDIYIILNIPIVIGIIIVITIYWYYYKFL